MKILLQTTLLVFSALTLAAQRPWLKVERPPFKEAPSFITAGGALYALADGLAITYRHGESWMQIDSIRSHPKALTEFINGSTVCFTQEPGSSVVHTFYSISGTNFSESDSLDLNTHHVVGAGWSGNTVYIATAEGVLYSWGTTIDSLIVPAVQGATVRQALISNELFCLMTTAGLFVSTDTATSWALKNPPSKLDGLDISTDVALYQGALLASTDQGVFVYDAKSGEWSAKGLWQAEAAAGRVLAIAAEPPYIVALRPTPSGRVQMYRLEHADSTWIPTAYEVPMPHPAVYASACSIDAGWVVAYFSDETTPDSTGVYAYNLNDMSDVQVQDSKSDIQLKTTKTGLQVSTPIRQQGMVTVHALNGAEVLRAMLSPGFTDITLPDHLRGPLGVYIRTDSGQEVRSLILW